jgi:hypothetical protein
MKDLIKIDFDVESISEKEKETIFLKIDHVFYKFIWLSEINPYHEMEQFYVLRYELVCHLKSHLDSKMKESSFVLASGEEINFIGNLAKLEVSLKLRYSKTAFYVTSNNILIKNMVMDLDVLNSTSGILTSSEEEKIYQQLINDNLIDKKITGELTKKDLEIIRFESILLKDKSCFCLTDVYKLQLNRDPSHYKGLQDLLLENFDYVYNTQSCDCGNPGCFFDILKENLLYFFKSKYEIKNGEVSHDQVRIDFDGIWDTLSPVQKASLIFLYFEFQNSTLLNLAFLKPNFSLSNYQFLLCYPYQPDSEEANWVREISTLSNFLIQSEK